jgi:hypothetical protein
MTDNNNAFTKTESPDILNLAKEKKKKVYPR